MENTQSQLNKFNVIFTKQGDVLQQKSQEIEKLVTELKQLTAIKDSISRFDKTMSAQNSKLDALANAIQALAKAKAEGTNVPVFNNSGMKMWKKILIGIGAVLGGLTLLSLLIANWDSIYWFLYNIFKI
jgi:chaperonin GroEL (HSP60 family)